MHYTAIEISEKLKVSILRVRQLLATPYVKTLISKSETRKVGRLILYDPKFVKELEKMYHSGYFGKPRKTIKKLETSTELASLEKRYMKAKEQIEFLRGEMKEIREGLLKQTDILLQDEVEINKYTLGQVNIKTQV